MPRNDYECAKHGVREIWFSGKPPRRCVDCGGRLRLLVSQNQFSLGGDMTWLTEKEKRGIGLQLGVVPENGQHLREIEKRGKWTRIDRREVKNSSSSERWREPDPKKLERDLRSAVERGRRNQR